MTLGTVCTDCIEKHKIHAPRRRPSDENDSCHVCQRRTPEMGIIITSNSWFPRTE